MCPGYKPIGKATVPINLTAVSSLQIHVFVHYNILLVGVAYMYVEGIQYLRHLPSSPFGSLSFVFMLNTLALSDTLDTPDTLDPLDIPD